MVIRMHKTVNWDTNWHFDLIYESIFVGTKMTILELKELQVTGQTNLKTSTPPNSFTFI